MRPSSPNYICQVPQAKHMKPLPHRIMTLKINVGISKEDNEACILQIIAITTKHQRRCSLVYIGVSLQTNTANSCLENRVSHTSASIWCTWGRVKTRMWGKEDTCQVTNRLLGLRYQRFWFEPNTSKFSHEAEQVWGAQSESTTVHVPRQPVYRWTQAGTGKLSQFLCTVTCSFHFHPEPFSEHALHQVNSPDHVFWQQLNAEWELWFLQFTHDPITKIFKKDL